MSSKQEIHFTIAMTSKYVLGVSNVPLLQDISHEAYVSLNEPNGQQDEHYETEIELNSNLMIPDFPHSIRIRLAQLNFFLLRPDVAKFLPCWLSQFSFSKLRQPTGQRLSNVRTKQTKISIGPILFLYYEESLVSIIKFEF